ncbi:hypothetical protein [Burkholderia anthina]|uniref:hypothetical protein n=1 Tax=Burkholderia anthina TaxID=179879 RepID=UPI00158B37CF|nr:hypothetical protein [Burkholderia anthina]
MKMFSKNGGNSDMAIAPAAKRDVTISDEPKKRPDHVRVESDECTWKIGLTLEEQFSLGQAYERGTDDEEQLLETFVESLYQSSAATLRIEIRPSRPGEVMLQASGDSHFRKSEFGVKYSEVAGLIYEWLAASQPREALVADLIASLPGEQE